MYELRKLSAEEKDWERISGTTPGGKKRGKERELPGPSRGKKQAIREDRTKQHEKMI